MKIEQKLELAHERVASNHVVSRVESNKTGKDLDTGELLNTIEDAIIAVHDLKIVISTIKDLVEGVKWYEFLKLAAIVKRILDLIKSRNWDV